jgi:hypothetical protein
VILHCAVTQESIDRGLHCATECPVGEAITNALYAARLHRLAPVRVCSWSVEFVGARFRLDMPPDVGAWIIRYDLGLSDMAARPFEFDLVLPDERIGGRAS